ALERSLNEIVRRHEVLRTIFPIENEDLIQVINRSLTLTLPVVDLQHLPEAERNDEVLRIAAEEAAKPFCLSLGPLVRATLLQICEKEQVLLLTLHHIISDGWSMGVLKRELALLYEVFSAGKPSPLSELPIQYADFAQWQRQWLQGEVLNKQL